MLPHHRQTSPEEFEEASRSRVRLPVRPHQRLAAARGWNLPIPEVLILIAGLLFQLITADPTSIMGRLALNAETAGWSALIIGIPLLFVPLRIIWFDIAYIVIGLAIYLYMMTFLDGSYIFLGLLLLAGMGMILAGVSFLARRIIAYRLALRRAGNQG